MLNRYSLSGLLSGLALAFAPLSSSAQSFNWAKSGGTRGYAVTTDANHNTIVVGTYNDMAQFGSVNLPYYGMGNGFVVKYDVSGNVAWAKGFGGSQNDHACAVATDAVGNVYVCGYYLSPDGVKFTASDSLTQTGVGSLFLAKYDASGNFLWVKKGTLGGNSNSIASALHMTAAGELIMGGTYCNSLTFGSTTITGGVSNLFLAKFDTSGNAVWMKSGTSTSSCLLNAVTSDASGNIYATGKVSNGINWGTGLLVNQNGGDQVIVTKFNSSGALQWLKHEGNLHMAGTTENMYDSGNGIGVDAAGNVYVGGSLLDTTYIQMPNMISRQWGMIAKYNSAGTKLWLKKIGGGNAHAVVHSLAMDAAGNPYIVGNYNDTMTISGTALPPSDSVDVFIARLDGNGNVTWVRTGGGPNVDKGLSIAVDADGSVVTTGLFEANASFGSFSLVGNSYHDMFVTRQANTVTSVTGMPEENGFTVYPNPASGVIHVYSKDAATVFITDAGGRTLQRREIPKGTSTLDIHTLTPGIYFLTVSAEGKPAQTGKIIVR